MPTAVVGPVRKIEEEAVLTPTPPPLNNNPPPLSTKSVQSTEDSRRILDLEYEEDEDEEDDDNLIIVNNQHVFLADSKSAVKMIDPNANEDITAARPIIPDFIASSLSSADSDDGGGEVNGATASRGLDDGSIKCLSGDEGLGDISSSASSPNPPPMMPASEEDGPPTKAPPPQLGSPCDERVPSRIPLSVQTNL